MPRFSCGLGESLADASMEHTPPVEDEADLFSGSFRNGLPLAAPQQSPASPEPRAGSDSTVEKERVGPAAVVESALERLAHGVANALAHYMSIAHASGCGISTLVVAELGRAQAAMGPTALARGDDRPPASLLDALAAQHKLNLERAAVDWKQSFARLETSKMELCHRVLRIEEQHQALDSLDLDAVEESIRGLRSLVGSLHEQKEDLSAKLVHEQESIRALRSLVGSLHTQKEDLAAGLVHERERSGALCNEVRPQNWSSGTASSW